MGKALAGRKLAGRLERGAVANASLLTVAEYLRAVRAGFGDLKDALDRYTSLPIPEPVRRLAEAAPLPRVVTGSRALVCVPGDTERREPRSRAPNPDQELEVLRVRRRVATVAGLVPLLAGAGVQAVGAEHLAFGASEYRRVAALRAAT